MSIQFFHDRRYTRFSSFGELDSKGGTTFAIETDDLDIYDFQVGKEVTLRASVAKCCPTDRYVRKTGTELCLQRLTEKYFTLISKRSYVHEKNTLGGNPNTVGKVITELILRTKTETYFLVKVGDAKFHLRRSYLTE
jgi:hypothetical protein